MGLRLGADDYITKPFSQRLLIERIRALLRRNEASRAEGSGAAPGGVMVRGELMLDETKHQCTWQGQDIQLTVTEFLLVKALAARPGMVKSRDQLIDAAYGENIYVDDRTIDSHVKRIRKKFRTVDDSVQPDRDALRHRLSLQGALSGPMPDGSTLVRTGAAGCFAAASGSARAGCRRCCAASCWSTRCRWRCWWRRCCISTSTRTACWRPRSRRCASRRASTPARWARARCARPTRTIRKLVPDIARPLLRRLTEPTPDAQAKLYAPGRHGDRRLAGARGPERRGQHRAAAAGGRARPGRRGHRLDLRQGAGPAAARDADAAGRRHRRRPRAGWTGSRT